MELWADIFDASGNRLGPGYIKTLLSAKVTRVLDGAGSINFRVPLTDERAIALCVNGNRAHLFTHWNGVTREIGRGIIHRVNVTETAANRTLIVSGPDDMYEVSQRNTFLGRQFDNVAIGTIATTLTGLVSGWSITSDGGLPNLSIRFDGQNILQALLKIAEQQGLHLRPGATAKTLELGAFGTPTTVKAYGPAPGHPQIAFNDDILLVDSIKIVHQSEGIVNWILPLGAGEGEAAITLEHSTRSSPYPIQDFIGPDGRTQYAITTGDPDITERIMKFDNIAPISNANTDLVAAANALYDAAAAELDRISLTHTIYQIRTLKPASTIRTGDKLRLIYKGIVEASQRGLSKGPKLTYIDVDTDLWILKATESIDNSGVARLVLKVSTVDMHQKSMEKVLVGAIEALRIRETRVQPYYSKSNFPLIRQADSSLDAEIPIKITNATMSLERCILRFTSRPLRATSRTALGSPHGHVFAAADSIYGGSYTTRNFRARDPITGELHFFQLPVGSNTSGTESLQSLNESPDHTHALNFGVADDIETPKTIRIAINGIDYTSVLGGPWDIGGGGVSVELNITDQINAAPTLQANHLVKLSCDSGQGEFEVTVELYEVIQTIAP